MYKRQESQLSTVALRINNNSAAPRSDLRRMQSADVILEIYVMGHRGLWIA